MHETEYEGKDKNKRRLILPSMLKNDIQSIDNDYIWRWLSQRAVVPPGFIPLVRSWRQCIYGMIDCGFVMRPWGLLVAMLSSTMNEYHETRCSICLSIQGYCNSHSPVALGRCCTILSIWHSPRLWSVIVLFGRW